MSNDHVHPLIAGVLNSFEAVFKPNPDRDDGERFCGADDDWEERMAYHRERELEAQRECGYRWDVDDEGEEE